MKPKQTLQEPANVLFRIKRGLAGYISYLAACEMNEAFSEYVLYEPMLRILTARGYTVECEYRCREMPIEENGERVKRIDLVARTSRLTMAIEVKWTENRSLEVAADHRKLAWFTRDKNPGSRGFLCVFGKRSVLKDINIVSGDYPGRFKEKGKFVCADLGATRYGCRVYELLQRPERA